MGLIETYNNAGNIHFIIIYFIKMLPLIYCTTAHEYGIY